MIRIISVAAALFLFSCASSKKPTAVNDLPSCLETKIKSMAENPSEGPPQSITRYHYEGRTVYYMVAPCCDKFNIVFDSACTILGYPMADLPEKVMARCRVFTTKRQTEK